MTILTQCQKIKNIHLCPKYIIPLCVAIVFIYGYITKNHLNIDPLEKSFAPCNGCDWWAVTHVLFFLLLGFLFPNNLFEIMIIGIVWEIFETIMGSFKIMVFAHRPASLLDKQKNGDYIEPWWYGRVTDIAFNLIGAISGSTLRSLL